MVVPLAAAVAVPLAVAAAAAAAEWETPGFRDSGRLLQLVSNASLRRSTVGIGRGARRGEREANICAMVPTRRPFFLFDFLYFDECAVLK